MFVVGTISSVRKKNAGYQYTPGGQADKVNEILILKKSKRYHLKNFTHTSLFEFGAHVENQIVPL